MTHVEVKIVLTLARIALGTLSLLIAGFLAYKQRTGWQGFLWAGFLIMIPAFDFK